MATIQKKHICYIFNGENWIKYIANNRNLIYVNKNTSPETAMLGVAKLGIMKLGEGE